MSCWFIQLEQVGRDNGNKIFQDKIFQENEKQMELWDIPTWREQTHQQSLR